MTVYDLRCDECGRTLTGPSGGDGVDHHAVRFVYHPGRPDLKDDSGLLCRACWTRLESWLGRTGLSVRCAVCHDDLTDAPRLVLKESGDLEPWFLCNVHAVDLLNRLRTVDPKLDPTTFRLPSPAG